MYSHNLYNKLCCSKDDGDVEKEVEKATHKSKHFLCCVHISSEYIANSQEDQQKKNNNNNKDY